MNFETRVRRPIDPDETPFYEPVAGLERQLIAEYLRGCGHDPDVLLASDLPESRTILAHAVTYVSGQLAVVQARAGYIRDMHAGH